MEICCKMIVTFQNIRFGLRNMRFLQISSFLDFLFSKLSTASSGRANS